MLIPRQTALQNESMITFWQLLFDQVGQLRKKLLFTAMAWHKLPQSQQIWCRTAGSDNFPSDQI